MMLVKMRNEDDSPWFFMGFTKEDLAKASNGKVAHVSLDELGIPGDAYLCIGEDEEELKKVFRESVTVRGEEDLTRLLYGRER